MRIFLAGATGVIGSRLVPLLMDVGHRVAALTRSEEKGRNLPEGVQVVVGDVFEREQIVRAFEEFQPELVMHQLTDLPDRSSRIGEYTVANARIRWEGTDNLLAAARRVGAGRFVAQSVAWRLSGEAGAAVEHLESAVLRFGGTVLRYGQFYGPGTYHEHEPPPPPRIHIDEAAERTVKLLEAAPGVIEITEPDQTA